MFHGSGQVAPMWETLDLINSPPESHGKSSNSSAEHFVVVCMLVCIAWILHGIFRDAAPPPPAMGSSTPSCSVTRQDVQDKVFKCTTMEDVVDIMQEYGPYALRFNDDHIFRSACMTGDLAVARFTFKHIRDPRLPLHDHMEVVRTAIRNGDVDMVKWLCSLASVKTKLRVGKHSTRARTMLQQALQDALVESADDFEWHDRMERIAGWLKAREGIVA